MPFSLHYWENVPFHAQLSCCLALACFFLCVLTYTLGTLLPRKSGLPDLPLIGAPLFPSLGDVLLTLVVALLFVAPLPFAILNRPEAQQTSAGEIQRGAIATVLLYMPMLVRYFLLPNSGFPKPKARQIIAFPICCVGVIFLLSFLIDASGLTAFITEESGSPEVQALVTQFQGGDRNIRLMIALSALVVAPVAEEVCFRGFLYNVLRQKSGKWAATVASALFFSSIHTALPQFLPLFIFGVVQCIAYEKARSLWLPICTHFLFNAISVLSMCFILQNPDCGTLF